MTDISTTINNEYNIVEVVANVTPIIEESVEATTITTDDNQTIIETTDSGQTSIVTSNDSYQIEVSDCGIQGPSGISDLAFIINDDDPSINRIIRETTLWWSPITGKMRLWHNGTWHKFATTEKTKHHFKSVEGQTVFNLEYKVGTLEIIVNGLSLERGLDFIAEDGEQVIFLEPMKQDWDVVIIETKV